MPSSQVAAGASDPASTNEPSERSLDVPLPDGRHLAGFDDGDPDARPVFFLTGEGAASPGAPLARDAGVRLLTIDRPGLGASSPHRGRTLTSFAADLAHVADALGIDRFSVLGVAGGGAHALAVAHALPARVRAVGLVGAVPPLTDAALAHLGRRWRRLRLCSDWAPWLVRRACAARAASFRARPDRYVDRELAALDGADAELLAQPDARATFAAATARAFAQGPDGLADDALAIAKEWRFQLSDVRAPVHAAHGARDAFVPVAAARWLASQLPAARLEVHEREGHHVLPSHGVALLKSLVG